MDRQWDFRYALPRPPEGGLVELSVAEAEKMLLKNLEEAKDDPNDALWELGRF
jgi:hypothetical protein